MPKFAYSAVNSEGEETFGVVEGENEKDAISNVSRQGFFVTDIKPAGIGDEWLARRNEEKKRREKEDLHRTHRMERAKKRQARQRLVIRFKDGRTVPGMCYALNPKENAFHLDLVDEKGITTNETQQVRYNDLKAVFYVKSFDGKFDQNVRYHDWQPEGAELIVKFDDGEIIEGYSLLRYDSQEPRFYLIPKDQTSNNISILVEVSAVEKVYRPEEYAEEERAKRQARKAEDVSADLSQEETLGDFYFETRNYPAALEQYQLAQKKHPQSRRILKKLLATQYNIGVQHIKRRDYPGALQWMEKILQLDPGNNHASKKVHQLRKIIEQESRSKGGAPKSGMA